MIRNSIKTVFGNSNETVDADDIAVPINDRAGVFVPMVSCVKQGWFEQMALPLGEDIGRFDIAGGAVDVRSAVFWILCLFDKASFDQFSQTPSDMSFSDFHILSDFACSGPFAAIVQFFKQFECVFLAVGENLLAGGGFSGCWHTYIQERANQVCCDTQNLRIKRFDSFEDSEKANRLANLITVCRDCHRQVEGIPIDVREGV